MPMIHAFLFVVELKNVPELTTTSTRSMKHVYRKHRENLEINVTVTNDNGTTAEYAADEDSEVESTTVDKLPSCSSQLQYMKHAI